GGQWTPVSHSSRQKFSRTTPPTPPPVSSAPTRRYHPSRLVLQLSRGERVDQNRLRHNWAALQEAMANAVRIRLTGWTLTGGGNLVLTVDGRADELTPLQMATLKEAACEVSGLTCEAVALDRPTWDLVLDSTPTVNPEGLSLQNPQVITALRTENPTPFVEAK